MFRWAIIALSLAALTACGVDGEPEVPEPGPNIGLSGSIEFGISGTF
ncbi:MAG: argininosuccinate lyase [Pseudomonadota bacterium]